MFKVDGNDVCWRSVTCRISFSAFHSTPFQLYFSSMTSKAKAKALADDFDDEEVVSMLGLETPTPGDADQWLRDNNNDLNWAYTARTMRKWSQDALVTHLWEKTFSIPPREYNPSAPFVWVQLASGELVTLPHGYRLPLMFVAKYRWETTLSKISNERQWKQERSNMFHLSRLCENLFRRAKVKASRGGMEKGWRCVMFDRLLARFYKHWARNDPEGGTGFLTTHGAKEYDRDVLKHGMRSVVFDACQLIYFFRLETMVSPRLERSQDDRR